MSWIPAELIKKKRRGEAHTKDEVHFLIKGYTDGSIPDYQMSAWLMAVCFKPLSSQETSWLTEAMMRSGRTLDFTFLGKLAVDKHSTGGVGDKTSLIIAPLVAAAGVPVPMMAGRGLGHTGGTLDKLESIPGFDVRLDLDRFKMLVSEFGTAIIGQTKDICPADLKLYSLRDVTGTVDSIPLICASIMSKKLAEGVQGLVLDVKFGSGAFMKTIEQAEALAKALVEIGHLNGVTMTAILTNMEQPLGRFVGNSVEVQECIDILQGKTLFENGIDFYKDTRDLSLELSAHMLVLGGKAQELESAFEMAEQILSSGAAWKKFGEMCTHQGAKANWSLPVAKHEKDILALSSGFITGINCEEVGLAAIELGAGRKRSDDKIDHAAGIEVLVKLGQPVTMGAKVFRIFSDDTNGFADAQARLISSLKVESKAVLQKPLIAARVTPEGTFL